MLVTLLAKAVKLEPDFGTQLFRLALLKYSQIHQDLLRFVPCQSKNLLFQNSVTRKGAVFGEAKLIRLAPMGDNEPKSIEKPPFRADSSFTMLWLAVPGCCLPSVFEY